MIKKNTCEPVLWLPSTNSTNAFFEKKLSEGYVFESRNTIVADFQTDGKGNGESKWESERGKNLLFSVYYEPQELLASQQFYLNMAVALGVLDGVKEVAKEPEVCIKWPNDIYVGNDKIAGMLIKHAVIGRYLVHSIIGIGLNVNQEQFQSNAPNPVSLIHYLNSIQNRKEILELLLNSLDIRLDQLESGDIKILKSEYLENLFAFKNYKEYLFKNRLIEAKIVGVSEYGSLKLEVTNGEELECNFKEIKLIL